MSPILLPRLVRETRCWRCYRRENSILYSDAHASQSRGDGFVPISFVFGGALLSLIMAAAVDLSFGKTDMTPVPVCEEVCTSM